MALMSFGLGCSPSAAIAAETIGLKGRPLACSIAALPFLASKYLRDTLSTGSLGDGQGRHLGAREYKFQVSPSKGIGLVIVLPGRKLLHLIEKLRNIRAVGYKHLFVFDGDGKWLGMGVFREPSWDPKDAVSSKSVLGNFRLAFSSRARFNFKAGCQPVFPVGCLVNENHLLDEILDRTRTESLSDHVQEKEAIGFSADQCSSGISSIQSRRY